MEAKLWIGGTRISTLAGGGVIRDREDEICQAEDRIYFIFTDLESNLVGAEED